MRPLPLARAQADLEQGLWGGSGKTSPDNTPLTMPFVTAMLKGGSNGFALKGGDATSGALKKMYDGPRPAGYQVRGFSRRVAAETLPSHRNANCAPAA